MGHHGHAGDEYVVAHFDMAHQANTPGEHAMLADPGAAGDPHAGGHGGVIANLHVVGDLNLVIQFHAVTNDGIGQGPAVNGSVDANFNVIGKACWGRDP